MNVLKILFFVVLCSYSFAQSNSQLGPYGYLDKLSKTLRGVPADSDEYVKLRNALKAGQWDAFLNSKIDEYLLDDSFRFYMALRLHDLFRVSMNRLNALTYMRAPLQQSMTAGNNDYYMKQTEAFRGAITNVIDPEAKWDKLLIGTNIFNSQTFLERYPTTVLNQNRKRAAAIFRIFLCDDMIPAVPISEEIPQDVFEVILPNSSAHNMTLQQKSADPHGVQADCKACHNKLDPVGALIQNGNNSPFRGLVYNSRTGQQVQLPLSNSYELANALTKQVDYNYCQTQHFWEWFVGPKEMLTPARHDELVRQFDRVEKRVGDFVKYLVTSEEFKTKMSGIQNNNAIKAISILNKCTNCHKDQNFNPGLKRKDLTQLVRDENQDIDFINLAIMRLQTRTMPPPNSTWKLTDEEINMLTGVLKSKAGSK